MSRTMPLYPSEAQIAREVLGPGRTEEWKGLVQVLERKGFPPIQPQYGGRFWEACVEWFRFENGLSSIAPGRFGPEDGEEQCPTPRKRRQDSRGGSVATVHKLHTGSHEKTP